MEKKGGKIKNTRSLAKKIETFFLYSEKKKGKDTLCKQLNRIELNIHIYLKTSFTYLHRGNIIGGYIAQTSSSVYNLPPVFLLNITLQQNEIFTFPEAESLGKCGLEVVQGLNHFVAIRSCKIYKM